jgi:hypothetical protein
MVQKVMFFRGMESDLEWKFGIIGRSERQHNFFFFFFFFYSSGIKPKALHLLDKCSTTELHVQASEEQHKG